MTYDHEVVLISEEDVPDGAGGSVPNEIRNPVLCGLKAINRNEFYQAAAAGLKPEVVLEINKYEYAGEEKVEFEGTRYRVMRTYPVDSEGLELVCEGLRSHAN